MLKADIELVFEIARAVAKEEIAKAIAAHVHDAGKKAEVVSEAPQPATKSKKF